ncbi:MAG TPA: hypothetical protein DCS93_37420 [Microscillaceae bacterium]|nr:hypothetical protein [Microscillaceae bacterium]
MKQKIQLLNTLSLLLWVFSAQAQVHSVGVVGGPSRSLINIKDGVGLPVNPQQNLVAGIQASILLDKNWFLEPELLYRQNGYLVPRGGGVETEVNFGYIALPVKVALRVGNKLQGFASVGLAPAFLLEAQAIGLLNGPLFGPIDNPNAVRKTYDIRVYTRSFDLSGLASIGLRYHFDSFAISLEGRYNYSFTGFDEVIHYYAERQAFHKSWQMLLGVHYVLGER